MPADFVPVIHRLTYRWPGLHNIHVRGYKEQGNINTPLELAIRNQTDRFSLAIDAIDRMPRFRVTSSTSRSRVKSTPTNSAWIVPRSRIGNGHSRSGLCQRGDVTARTAKSFLRFSQSRRFGDMEKMAICGNGKLKFRKE
jgi:hypothetical protein